MDSGLGLVPGDDDALMVADCTEFSVWMMPEVSVLTPPVTMLLPVWTALALTVLAPPDWDVLEV